MKRIIYSMCILGTILMLVACSTSGNDQNDDQEETSQASVVKGESEKAGKSKSVQVELVNTNGEKTGEATLTQVSSGVSINIKAWGLTAGEHGFHIHENGMCDPPTFDLAGAHFNPTDAKHGFDNPEGPHAGDLPNLEVGRDGKVEATILNERVTLTAGEGNSLLKNDGTSLVIHSKADDYVSQPSGNSGERVACGVIKK